MSTTATLKTPAPFAQLPPDSEQLPTGQFTGSRFASKKGLEAALTAIPKLVGWLRALNGSAISSCNDYSKIIEDLKKINVEGAEIKFWEDKKIYYISFPTEGTAKKVQDLFSLVMPRAGGVYIPCGTGVQLVDSCCYAQVIVGKDNNVAMYAPNSMKGMQGSDIDAEFFDRLSNERNSDSILSLNPHSEWGKNHLKMAFCHAFQRKQIAEEKKGS